MASTAVAREKKLPEPRAPQTLSDREHIRRLEREIEQLRQRLAELKAQLRDG